MLNFQGSRHSDLYEFSTKFLSKFLIFTTALLHRPSYARPELDKIFFVDQLPDPKHEMKKTNSII